jgi:DMSO/TMAO reductase YedYZ molybdopterin-dependent catalytic subunit
MRNKRMKKVVASAAGLIAMQGAVVASTVQAETGIDYQMTASDVRAYDQIANISGDFSFDQNVVSPSDKVFSLFGTAATGVCAIPNFVFEENRDNFADYYLNVGGELKKAFQISLSELKEQGENKILKCSCAMSSAVVNAEIVGVPIENIVQIAELDKKINTVTVKGSDGYTVSLPLKDVLEKRAMLVYKIGGEGLKPEQGGPVQLWMPGSAANYFTRQVVELSFSHAKSVAALKAPSGLHRAKVNILNRFEDVTFTKGTKITFEGYADDFDVAIDAIEFSMDGGTTWTTFETPDTNPNKWVYWYFTYDANQNGHFRLDVRSRTADGKVSPLASSVEFTVSP